MAIILLHLGETGTPYPSQFRLSTTSVGLRPEPLAVGESRAGALSPGTEERVGRGRGRDQAYLAGCSAWRSASMEMVTLTSSPRTAPPVSSARFQVMPYSLRSS